MDKIIVINKSGQQISLVQWQELYGIKGDQIGKYFSYKEDRFQRDLKMYGRLIVNELLMRVSDQYREDKGKPTIMNAFNRDINHQKELGKQGFRTASWSPHVVYDFNNHVHGGIAADYDTSSHQETDQQVTIYKQAAKKLGIKVRIGWKEYQVPSAAAPNGYTFFHGDVGPEYYAVGKPWHTFPHPVAWEREIVW